MFALKQMLCARADYLITGDNDLLEVEAPGKLEIISPVEFLKII